VTDTSKGPPSQTALRRRLGHCQSPQSAPRQKPNDASCAFLTVAVGSRLTFCRREAFDHALETVQRRRGDPAVLRPGLVAAFDADRWPVVETWLRGSLSQ